MATDEKLTLGEAQAEQPSFIQDGPTESIKDRDNDQIILECFLLRDAIMWISQREPKHFETDNSIRMMALADIAMNSTIKRGTEFAKARSTIISFYREINGEEQCAKWLIKISYVKLDIEESSKRALARNEFAEVVKEYSSKYYFVLVGNNKPFILSYINGALRTFTKVDFQTFTIGDYITAPDGGKLKRHQKSDIWLKSGEYPKFTRYGFFPDKPPGPNGDTFNIWPGFATVARPGNCDKMKFYFLEILANGNDKYCKEITQFFAHMVQRPWEKTEKCLAFVGDYSSGKSALVKLMRIILDSPDRALKLCTQSEDLNDIFGNWNDHIESTLLLGIDEIRWRFVPQLMGRVKGFITNSTLSVKTRFISQRTVDSHIRVVLTNNPEDRIPVALHERRRYDIFRISDKYRWDKAFWDALFYEASHEGGAAFLDYLMHYDISDFNPRESIVTEELTDHKINTLTGIYAWWMDNFVVTGQLFYDGIYPDGSVRINKAELRSHFNKYRQEVMGLKGEVSAEIFGVEFAGMISVIEYGEDGRSKVVMNEDGRRPVTLIRNTKVNGYPAYVIPSLEKTREVMEHHLGGPHDWSAAIDIEDEANEYWADHDPDAFRADQARVFKEDNKIKEAIKMVGDSGGASIVAPTPKANWVKIDLVNPIPAFSNARFKLG